MCRVVNGTFVSFLRSNILHDFDRYLMSRQVYENLRYFCRTCTEYSESVSNIILLLYFFYTCNQSSLLSPSAFRISRWISLFASANLFSQMSKIYRWNFQKAEVWHWFQCRCRLVKGLSVAHLVKDHVVCYNELLLWIENESIPPRNIRSLLFCLAGRYRNILEHPLKKA